MKQEVKVEPTHQDPSSCSNADMVTIAITLNPVATQVNICFFLCRESSVEERETNGVLSRMLLGRKGFLFVFVTGIHRHTRLMI